VIDKVFFDAVAEFLTAVLDYVFLVVGIWDNYGQHCELVSCSVSQSTERRNSSSPGSAVEVY